MVKKCALVAALLLVLGPASARADWLFIPNIGTGFGGDLPKADKLTYGASIGWMGAGVLGWEADLAYTPQFFENGTDNVSFADSDNVTSVMGNVIVGIPIGGQHGPGFRPYGVAGVGIMKEHVADASQLFNVDNNDLGFNVGVGALGFLSDHVGLRGDVRYFRDFENHGAQNNVDLANLGVGNFDFWRGTIGLAFRW
jgi:hypothetical protein